MTQPLAMDDFFILEAGEYLERMGIMVASESPPSADELVRFTRALRGSALMANQHAIARAAGGLEQLVRAYREGRRGWDPDLASLCIEAVGTLRALVEGVRHWTADHAARAERLVAMLEGSAGSAPRPAAGAPPAASEAGVRAFLAREAAAVGSALDQAARSLRATPGATDAAQMVLRRMQPLRGLAALADYPPLVELLDGIEGSVAALSRFELGAPEIANRFEAAAKALGRAARDIAEIGRPEPEAAEFRAFAALLLATSEAAPVVPIEQLFYAGEDGIVLRGTPPRGTQAHTLAPLSIVSRGEHLRQVADEIAHAASPTQRELRLHTLMADLRVLASGLQPPLERAVEHFAGAARAAIARGGAARDPGRFAELLGEAGARLRAASDTVDPASLARHFEELADAMGTVGTEPAPVTAVASGQIDTDELPIVPIESLELTEETPDLAASWTEYEALLSGARAGAATAGERAPAPAAVAAREGPPIVDIDSILYRGRSALERAQEVGSELRRALAGAASGTALRPLVEELLDLVTLAEHD
ncbi:MAG TPA: hypothetical protein VNJ71_00370 [Gemmatimonadales bacterium]|jgi:chemotaxis protein histidine kinase CheA|nr:hypothetical protein [Gemmatimonadales bacterium]